MASIRERRPIGVSRSTAFGLGVANDGGYAEYVRVPADWVVPIQDELTHFDTMAIGTAGFTSALSVAHLEPNGLAPTNGPVIVTGATSGVDSVAVDLLATLGYEITAKTGKDGQHDYLRSLGATTVLSRHELELGTRALEKAMWADAVDPAGGRILAWLTRTMQPSGSIASSGLSAGVKLETTVMPFILCGINLLGIDSVLCPMDRRREVWRRLATDMKPTHLRTIACEITLTDLPEAFETLLTGTARGRYVVKIGG